MKMIARWKSIGILLLALCLLLSGCIREKEKPDEKNGDELVHYYLNTTYTYPTVIDEGVLTTGLDASYLLLANKQNALGPNYAPQPLGAIPSNLRVDKEMYLEARALAALELMMAEMRATGIQDVLVTSAYRSYQYQESLFNTYLQTEASGISVDAERYFGAEYIYRNYTSKGLTALSWADAEAVVRSYSAFPGTSEHQSGLCVDFVAGSVGLTEAFEGTTAFRWLSQNAYRYGFILRYPKDKTDVTGYTYEPWHYRFVGREAATDIYFSGLTLEEYVAALN